MRKASSLFVLLSIVLVGLSACGNKKKNHTSDTTKSVKTTVSSSKEKIIIKSKDGSNGEIIGEDNGTIDTDVEIIFNEDK